MSTDRAILISAILLLAAIHCACSGSGAASAASADSIAADTMRHPLPDTLRVGTLYSPTSYFIYRETLMGYDYDLVSHLTAEKGMVLDLHVIPNLASAVEQLDSGAIDLIAYEVPVTAEYRNRVVPCGVETITHQVLVQPKKNGEEPIRDVTQLVGREVYVEKDSRYHHRLINLNEELGGGITIKPIDRDTLITEDLIAMVSRGEIPLTIVDSDIARINKTYYNDLDITLEVSFPQRSAWGVAPGREWLADSINAWTRQENPRREQAELLKRYFEYSKSEPAPALTVDFSHGRISPFDALFRRHAATIGWDWRLLAAQGYTESHFDSTQVSWAGARGVMQLMPSTARANGLSQDRITNNNLNIATAVKVIASLERTFAPKVKDSEERKKFVIAAYNSGAAHILDAIALAAKYGMNPQKWDGSVAEALLMKSKPEYYNDPVCRYGYFRGRQTYDYVRRVYDFYSRAKSKIPR
ncbi:MAG: transporter substrate-binding domain-containing protein [Muribaculaceae bacterium]|nr:transporter substrate-binding domain-containing protein [Muribaculaceae bacterium]